MRNVNKTCKAHAHDKSDRCYIRQRRRDQEGIKRMEAELEVGDAELEV